MVMDLSDADGGRQVTGLAFTNNNFFIQYIVTP